MTYKVWVPFVAMLFLLAGCSAVEEIYSTVTGCRSGGIVDYADVLLVNGIEYSSIGVISDEAVIGKKLGETKLKIQDNFNVCDDYAMEDFDATHLPEGTPIYRSNQSTPTSNDLSEAIASESLSGGVNG